MMIYIAMSAYMAVAYLFAIFVAQSVADDENRDITVGEFLWVGTILAILWVPIAMSACGAWLWQNGLKWPLISPRKKAEPDASEATS